MAGQRCSACLSQPVGGKNKRQPKAFLGAQSCPSHATKLSVRTVRGRLPLI